MENPVEKAQKIFGFMEPEELEWLYEVSKRMDSIVEIGSYKGKSTYVLCAGCPGKVYAVDFFSCGGMWPDPDGSIDTWPAFEANVGHFPNLCPVRMTSGEAATFGPVPGMVDMVFLDGCHEKTAVLHDLALWTPRTQKLICGHDLNHEAKTDTPGVGEALSEFFGMEKVARGPGSIWYVDL